MNKSTGIYNFLRTAVISLTVMTLLAVCGLVFMNNEEPALSQVGSSGKEVTAIQQKLKERGLFNVGVTGYYGEETRKSVLKFQNNRGSSRQESPVRLLSKLSEFQSELSPAPQKQTSTFSQELFLQKPAANRTPDRSLLEQLS